MELLIIWALFIISMWAVSIYVIIKIVKAIIEGFREARAKRHQRKVQGKWW